MNTPAVDQLVRSYLTIKRQLLDAGWGPEIDWQGALDFAAITETDFLRETAWVILSAGMAERVVQVKFPLLTRAFQDWCNSEGIVAERRSIRRQALKIFNHEGKIDAILQVAWTAHTMGFPRLKECIARDGASFLEQLPYVGAVTSLHLAKNLGLDVAKPDRHLVRIAEVAGYDSAAALCAQIADVVGDRISVVDLVLWRFATQERSYRDHFRLRELATAH